MSLNIGGDKSDMSFRYKMPQLVCKVEGRGNGIKTVVVNMADVAKALHIHPAYPTKYFGIELGANSKYNIVSERAIVNGSHTAADLQKILDKFIQQFILCPVCKLPELKMTVKSSIKIDCAACGHNSIMKTQHKLAGYIIKNDSTIDDKAGEKKDRKYGEKEKLTKKLKNELHDDEFEEAAADKKEKKAKKAEKKEKKKGDDAGDDEAELSASSESETEEERRIRKEKKKAKKEARKRKEAEAGAAGSDAEDAEANGSDSETEKKEKPKKKEEKAAKKATKEEDEWHTDISKEAIKARKAAEMAAMNNGKGDIDELLAKTNISGNANDSPVEVLKLYLASGKRSTADISAELKRIQISRGLDDSNKMKTLLEAIMDLSVPKNIAAQFKQHAALLKSFCPDRSSSNLLLQCIEDLVGVVDRKLLSFTPHILKTLYEADVLDEDVILAWFDAPAEASWLVNKEIAAEVRAKAAPFATWLREAEEEEEDDDE